MALEIKVDNPSFEKGVEMDFYGVLVKNGESVTLTPEQEAVFIANSGDPRAAFRKHKNVTIKGSVSKEGGES